VVLLREPLLFALCRQISKVQQTKARSNGYLFAQREDRPMSAIGQRYAVPAEIDQFVDQGFLEVLAERSDRMTVEFHIPSRVSADHRGRITAYRIVWIHPAYKAEG
jgi:hypothetical protein